MPTAAMNPNVATHNIILCLLLEHNVVMDDARGVDVGVFSLKLSSSLRRLFGSSLA